jgi:cholesterol oxidase
MANETPHPVGVQFTETMRGYLSTAVQDDYQRGFEQGKKDGTRFEFTLTVTSDDVDKMIADPGNAARMAGTVTATALSPQPLQVTDGRFNLFVADPERAMTRKMIYRMPMKAADGRVFFMEGFKTIHNDPGPDMWPDTTTLYVTVHEGADSTGPVLGKGIVHIKVADFTKQLSTMKAVGARNKAEEIKAVAKFGDFFYGVLNQIYGGVFAKATVFNPDAPPRQKRPLRLSEPEVHFFNTSDGVRLKLTRYQGGEKGPVILSPGFGTSGLAFTIDTTDTNYPEYLFERGYDVWVLDYRASPDLPSASTQFTLDDIALKDYPAAVDTVREKSGRDSVQVMAHCVGSLTLLMALSQGLEGVRSAVSSQLTLHPVPPMLNKLKADLYLANFLTTIGVDTLDTEFNKHEQLNEATHLAMHEMFGVANMETFQQITLMLRKGHAVSAEGEEVYLPNVDRIKPPIAFLHGAENRLFLPKGSELTYQLLCEKNGPDRYVRHVVPNYAHMDCFIGRDAARDVYPIVTAELDKYNPA